MENRGNILIVDDSYDTLILLSKLLNKEGYTTYPADSGELASASIKKRIPDLILLDIQMPGMDGYEVCRRIKSDEKFCSIPVIFLSGATEINDRVEGFRIGAIDFITKPFEKEELFARVKTHIDLSVLNKALIWQTKILQEKNEEFEALNEEYLAINQELKSNNEQFKQLYEELKFAKEKAEESESILKAAMENSQAGIAIAESPSGRLKYVNKAGLLIRNKDIDELVTNVDIEKYVSSWQILHFNGTPYKDDEVPLARAILYGETCSKEFIIRRENNEDRYVLANAAPIYNEKGIQNGAIVVFLDITDKKQAEEALIKSEQKLETMLQTMVDGMVTVDLTGQITYCNKAAEQILDMSKNILGKYFQSREWRQIDEQGNPFPQEQLPLAIVMSEQKIVTNFQHALISSNGEWKWLSVNAAPLFEDTGKFIGGIASFRDITAQKQDELIISQQNQELKKLNNDKDRFISILAHDLKNPLSTITGFLQLLAKNVRKYDIDKIENQVYIINETAKRTYHLLEDLLLWTSVQSGKLTFNPQKLNFLTIYRNIIEYIEPTAKNKNIIIKQLINEDFTFYADIDMIKTILRNLVSNAIKFTNKGGEIKINAKKDDKKIIFTVTDNGIGINPDEFQKLFDISESHTSIGTDGEKGTGLGLLLCKEFVEKHGGKIWAESQENIGSTFFFTLPLTYLNHEMKGDQL